MAPEIIQVLHAQLSNDDDDASSPPFYDFKCDVWSLGIVVYSLLVGGRPYSMEDVTKYVAEGADLPDLSIITTHGPDSDKGHAPSVLHTSWPVPWDFIMKCLTPDFNLRPSSSELLDHAWIQNLRAPTTPSTALDLKGRLRSFAALSEFKKVALLAAVRHLSAYEHEEIRALFQRIDVNNKGVVTVEELTEALTAVPPSTPGAPTCEDLFGALDSDRSGDITYTEFLAAVMDHHLEDREDLARAAFESFDQDGDGSISKLELELVLNSGTVKEIMMLGDRNLDGEISFEEFLDLLKRG
jgi:calcium-dependent protein kinase